MLNIDGTVNEPAADYGLPVFRLGFRPFFLAACIYAVVSMLFWMSSYVFSAAVAHPGLSPYLWHAHEMLFGYVLAVISGFLLTAIKNWTGIEVLRGKLLAMLLLLWLAPRLMLLGDFSINMSLIAVIDVFYIFMLTLVCLRPVLKVKQYKQVGIISMLFLLMLCNAVFYLGAIGIIEQGMGWGVYSALYLVIILVMVMMRRVMPMFISNGVDGDVVIKNHAWADISSLVLLICLWVVDVFTGYSDIAMVIAVLLTVLHVFRLYGWYTHKIWSKPLVWVLVVAYGFFTLGFALKALSLISVVPVFLAVHAFTAGGIGLVTLGMMARVALGHTGRNVFDPPSAVFWIMLILLLSAIFRVVVPLLSVELYRYWVVTSQVLWIAAFSLFIVIYAPMLLSPRIDGRDG